MLSDREKKEIIEDAASGARRRSFLSGNNEADKSGSLDDYMEFLMDIQAIFRPFPVATRPGVTKLNKL